MPSSSMSGGVEIKGLLSGGAHVIVTTSRYSRATVEYYFQRFDSRGSALTRSLQPRFQTGYGGVC